MPKTLKFKKLMHNVEHYYTGKPVPLKYQSKYGKRYSLAEAKSVAYAIAKSRGYRV